VTHDIRATHHLYCFLGGRVIAKTATVCRRKAAYVMSIWASTAVRVRDFTSWCRYEASPTSIRLRNRDRHREQICITRDNVRWASGRALHAGQDSAICILRDHQLRLCDSQLAQTTLSPRESQDRNGTEPSRRAVKSTPTSSANWTRRRPLGRQVALRIQTSRRPRTCSRRWRSKLRAGNEKSAPSL